MTVASYKMAKLDLEGAGVDCLTANGAKVEELRELEKLLNCPLTNSYREMLLDTGVLGFEGQFVSGIGRDGLRGSNYGNVWFATINSREKEEIGPKMIWIMPSGYGPDFVLDCGQLDQRGEAPVYEINELGYKHGMRKVADSFGEFLLNEVKTMLANR